jgi:ABC-type multidrug transport system permease subunit
MSVNRRQGERLVNLVGLLLVLPISVFAITRTDSGVVQAASLLVALVFVGIIHLIGVWLFGQKD